MPREVPIPGSRRSRWADCLDGKAHLWDYEELGIYFEDKDAVNGRANDFRQYARKHGFTPHTRHDESGLTVWVDSQEESR